MPKKRIGRLALGLAMGMFLFATGACTSDSPVPSTAARSTTDSETPETQPSTPPSSSTNPIATLNPTAAPDPTATPNPTATPDPTIDPDADAASPPHRIRSVAYDSGMSDIGFPSGSRSVRGWGVVAAPTDVAGPLPVAVVLHGAHSFCAVEGRGRTWPCPPGTEIAHQQGLTYLVEALAKRGFLAIAPGLNAEFADRAPSSEITLGLIDRELRNLLDPSAEITRAFGGDLPSYDPSRLVLVGHSRGGSTAVELARSIGSESGGLRRWKVNGLVLLEPNADTVDPSLLPDIPTVVVIGTCDGDTGVDGAQFVTRAFTTRRASPVALAMVRGATHNGTNAGLLEEAMLPGRPACGTGERLKPEEQRVAFAELVPDAARQFVGPTVNQRFRLFDPLRPADDLQAGLRIVHIDPTAQRTTLLPRFGRPVTATPGLVPVWCPAGRFSASAIAGTEQCHRLEQTDLVGVPAGLALRWDQPGAAIVLAAPQTTPQTTPQNTERPATVRDGTSFMLVVRLLPDPIDERLGGGPVVIALNGLLRSGSVWNAEIVLPVSAVGDVPDSPFPAKRGALLWSERRLALTGPLAALTLTVTSPRAGSVLLVGAEVVTVSP